MIDVGVFVFSKKGKYQVMLVAGHFKTSHSGRFKKRLPMLYR